MLMIDSRLFPELRALAGPLVDLANSACLRDEGVVPWSVVAVRFMGEGEIVERDVYRDPSAGFRLCCLY